MDELRLSESESSSSGEEWPQTPPSEGPPTPEQLLMAGRIELVLRQMEEEIRTVADDEEKLFEVIELMWQLLGRIVIDAVGLVDSRSVKRIADASGRHALIEICPKSTGIAFQLYPNVNYCLCPHYQDKVIKEKSAFTCEHVVAARLAECMNAVGEEKTPYIEGMLERLRRFIPEFY